MKITGGKYKGKNIDARPDKTLRPTSGRIREVVFNILRHGRFMKNENFIHDDNPDLIEGRRVVDIFCGTGALGIEALSRGAAHVTFIDQNAKTLSITHKNLESLGEENNSALIRSDSTNLPCATSPCNLVFIDPPYGMNLVTPSLKTLRDNGWLEMGSVIIVEQGKKDELVVPDGFNLLDERTHDVTNLSVLQFAG